MGRLKLKVNWLDERPDDNDDNEGKHHGIYIFDCDEQDFDEEAGFGSYDVKEVFWYADQDHRDEHFNNLDK